MAVNTATVIGNLGADPQIRALPSGQNVATLSLAMTERFTDRNGARLQRATRTCGIRLAFAVKRCAVRVTMIEKRTFFVSPQIKNLLNVMSNPD